MITGRLYNSFRRLFGQKYYVTGRLYSFIILDQIVGKLPFPCIQGMH